jgi:inward rectifier potassium channel
MTNKFFCIGPRIDKINLLTLSWTLVHPITEDSPLYKYTRGFWEAHGEIIVMITAFDDMFSNTVAIRTSYTFNELVYGAKFEPMFTRSTDNSKQS